MRMSHVHRMCIACASHVHRMWNMLKAVDFGVVLGLGWGTASVLFFWTRGILWGRWPEAGEKEQQFVVDVWSEVGKCQIHDSDVLNTAW